MNVEVAKRILERAGIERDEFASMCGVKPVSMRMTFYNGRFSKKAIAKLKELADEAKEAQQFLSEIQDAMGSQQWRLNTALTRIGMFNTKT